MNVGSIGMTAPPPKPPAPPPPAPPAPPPLLLLELDAPPPAPPLLLLLDAPASPPPLLLELVAPPCPVQFEVHSPLSPHEMKTGDPSVTRVKTKANWGRRESFMDKGTT